MAVSSLPLRRLRALLATVSVFAVAVLALICTAAGARAAGYVALGDSFASGPFIPNPVPPYGCLRSDHNYSHLAAPRIGLPFTDVTCGGAQTDDMFAPQNVQPDGPNPPQLDALAADTTVVSLNIGGNDIGFGEIVENCLSASPFGSPCRDHYTAGGVDEISRRIAETAPKLDAVLDAIRARSPKARVFLLNYAAIFPETGLGCWPQMPVAYEDVPYLRAKHKELNAMLAKQARRNRTTLVDWYAASIGHDACKDPLTRWVEPAVPVMPAAPIHPNQAGMEGAAVALLASAGAG